MVSVYDTLKERFLRYVKFETRSDETSDTIPSTPSQMEFAKMLKKELEELGLENVFINKACFVNATLPSNIDKKVKTIGFIAHMDTADFNAVGISPKIIENYDGKDIVLNKEKNIANLNPKLLLFLTTGICGGFTTFSTFSLETVQMIEQNKILEAIIYVLISVTLSLIGICVGYYLAKLI